MKKQVLVSVDRGETRVALLEAAGTPGASKRRGGVGSDPGRGYRVAELYLERRGARSIVGNIYKGVVDNVLVGLEAAFVDIGLDKNGFLHVDEIVLPGVEAPGVPEASSSATRVSPRSTLTSTCFFTGVVHFSQKLSTRPFVPAAMRACAWIDWSRPRARNVVSTEEPP